MFDWGFEDLSKAIATYSDRSYRLNRKKKTAKFADFKHSQPLVDTDLGIIPENVILKVPVFRRELRN